MTKKTEEDISIATAKFLKTQPNYSATYAEIINSIPGKYIQLDAEDTEESSTRTGEEMWEQIVRNITSHRESSNNYINLGYFEAIKSGLKLTPKGVEKF